MVLSNYKVMLIQIQISRILFQLLQVHSKHVSSNRIKIQVILLILQSETDYFSSYSFQNVPFEAVALQSSQRLPELQFYMKKSYRILQLQFYKGTHTHTSYIRYREFSIQNPILHAEDKELFEYYYYYIQRARNLHSRKEILRIEGKEIF